jgi:hypothetical protein
MESFQEKSISSEFSRLAGRRPELNDKCLTCVYSLPHIEFIAEMSGFAHLYTSNSLFLRLLDLRHWHHGRFEFVGKD